MHDQQDSGQRFAVIGAGVVGLTTAYHLAMRGHQVTVIDQAEAPASGCSYANAGIIAVGHAESWAGPAAPRQMLGAVLGRAPSVKISKLLDPDLWRWGLAFLRHCTARAHATNSDAMARLSRHGRRMLQDLEQATGLDFDQDHDGAYYLYGDRAAYHARVESLSDGDQGFVPLSASELIKRDPALRAFEGTLQGGLVSSVDSKGDCHRFTQALAEWLQQNTTVTFCYGTSVTGYRRAEGRVQALQTPSGEIACDQLVVAAGTGTLALTASLGVRPLIYPVKGYSATYTILDDSRIPQRPFVDETNLVAVTRLGDRLRVTGIAEFAGHDSSPRADRAAHLDGYVARHFTGAVDIDGARHWAGLRPSTPSGRPYIGQLRNTPNVWLNAGHGQLGWTMAAGAAQVLSDLVDGVRPAPSDVSETASWLKSA